MVGYMLTWTTYGTWLQGDKRGYIKDGQILSENEALYNANRKLQKSMTVTLPRGCRQIVKEAILKEAKEIGQRIYAMAICSNHVHIVAGCVNQEIGKVAGRYKKSATNALRQNGFTENVWTKGFDKRFCFDEKELNQRINYVQRHNEITLEGL